jgi:3-oxoacyl-[acyl-carrier-protein] synthase III
MEKRFPVIVSSGSYVPETILDNEEVFEMAQPVKPCGSPVPPIWIEKHFGIKERAFNYDVKDGRKLSKYEGGVYDSDLAIESGRRALSRAGVNPQEVGTLIHISATPGSLHFQSHMTELVTRLRLSDEVHAVHLDLGCASLAVAFTSAYGDLLREPDKNVLIVVSQCTSAIAYNRALLSRYLNHPDPWAWLGFAVFSDGGGSVLLRLGKFGERRGILHTWYKSMMDNWVIRHEIGGSASPVTHGNLERNIYTMNAKFVGENFTKIIYELFGRLKSDWREKIEPIVCRPFSISVVDRWYLHQANAVKIRETTEMLGIPADLTPTNVERLGNTSSASTLLLLDDDMSSGAITEGNIAVFLWVGGGNGAQYGYSVVVI